MRMQTASVAARPRVVLTVGVHGSASTGVFNAVRELLGAACGPDRVAAGFAASAGEVATIERRPDQHLVVKTHGWADLPGFAAARDATVIVSVRDPRDAVLSVMQRFGDPLDACVGGVGRDCRCARECADAGHDVLRYEDAFFDDPATLRGVAAALGLVVPDDALDRIFADWRTDAVRTRAAAVASLPPGQRRDFGARLTLDAATLVTHTHIGDGRSGKWREAFDAAMRARLTAFFAPFLLRFGYPLA